MRGREGTAERGVPREPGGGELTLANDREHSSHWRGATATGHHVQEAAGRLGHFRGIGTFQEG